MRSTTLLLSFLGALALSLSVAACNDSPAVGEPDAAVDAGGDGHVPDDAAPDGGTVDACEAVLTTGVTFDLDLLGPDMQIQASAAFDGEGVWVAYVLPGANNYFDIWAVRIACDGSVLWGPERINTTDNNETEPSVAVADGTVCIVWQADDNTGGYDNMDIFVRTFEADGTPIMDLDRIVETTKGGTPVTGNAWMPEVAALPSGQFAVAGGRGVPDATAFQVFVQRLDDDGALAGEALDAMWEPGVSQFYPTLAALADGTIYVAFERAPLDGDEQILHTRFAPGAVLPDPDPPVAAQSNTLGFGASYAADPAGERVYLAFGDGARVVLTDGAVFGDGPQVTLNQGSGLDHSPVVVPTADGGAIFWYLHLGGVTNAFHAAPFTYDGVSFTLGETISVTPSYVPHYQPAVTHVRGSVYFAAWSEGTNPDFRIKGKFLTVE